MAAKKTPTLQKIAPGEAGPAEAEARPAAAGKAVSGRRKGAPGAGDEASAKATAKTPAKAGAKPGLKPAAKPAAPRRRGPKPLGRAEIEEVFRRFHTADPEPKGELEYLNPYTLLVAVVLSAQATDTGVNKATRPLFAIADTPEKMVALGEDTVRDYIKTIGLFRAKAKNVIALSQQLIERFGSQVPRSQEALESLPGVGRKTANVVMNIAFAEPTIAVDTHLFRVSNRIPLAPGKTPLAVELGLLKVVPAAYRQHAHHWLILHGRYVCKARRPECWRCLIADLCRFEPKSLPPGR